MQHVYSTLLKLSLIWFSVFQSDIRGGRLSQLDKDIALIALPTLATLAADPIASLVDTAYIGHLGMFSASPSH